MPLAMKGALDLESGLDWTNSGVSLDEADAMQLAVATLEQRDTIVETIDDDLAAGIHSQWLELVAADLAEMVFGKAAAISRMREAWSRCSSHARDFLTAFETSIDKPARLNILLLEAKCDALRADSSVRHTDPPQVASGNCTSCY